MCILKLYGLILIIICLILFILTLTIYTIKIDEKGDIRNLDFIEGNDDEYINETNINITGFFLNNLKLMRNFSEKDVEYFYKRFDFSRKLFHLEHDIHSWENDCDLFIQTCLTALNILAYLKDPESIYYKNKKISKMLIFSERIISNKLKDNNSMFIDNEKIYHFFTSFTISMYVFKNLFTKFHQPEEYNDYYKYMDFYLKKFDNEFDLKMNLEIFKTYKIYFQTCKYFNNIMIKSI